MTLKEALKQLEKLGNEKVRALNIRNGAGEDQFGVKLGDIRTLAKKIGSNHELALSLWETGNLDARLLATLLVKPKSLSVEELEKMVRSIDVAQLADWLNPYVVKQHPQKETLRQKWMTAKDRWLARAG
jgi:3-methyladenine DNA glycosylase AlkD